jgi:hypothetical protein
MNSGDKVIIDCTGFRNIEGLIVSVEPDIIRGNIYRVKTSSGVFRFSGKSLIKIKNLVKVAECLEL